MKKFILLGLTIMMAVSTLMLQGCHNSEAQEAPAPSAPTIATYNVGWNSLSLEEKNTIIGIGTSKQPGGKVSMSPRVTEFVSVNYLYGVPSPIDSCQTLINYRYKGVSGLMGDNQVLIKGHLDGIENLGSLPDLLNNNDCCFRYGGCIKAYECDQPLPSGKECKPCETAQPKKEECLPCKKNGGDPGAARRQGDGAATPAESDGGNRVLPRIGI